MDPENYPSWLKKKIDEYTGTSGPVEYIHNLPSPISVDLLKKWVETKNPLFIWKALDLILKHNFEIPKWVKLYLLKCSENLLQIPPDIGEKAASEVYKSLGMSKVGKNPFDNLELFERKEKAWTFVEHYLEAHPKASLEKAYTEIAKILNCSEETIKKDHQKYRNFILKGDNEFPNPF